ncbi:hypothetical protein [Shouchella clausii]|nr:hypothetical protein [Shouchella clausii]
MDESGERREKKRPSVVADFAESEGRDDTTTSKKHSLYEEKLSVR